MNHIPVLGRRGISTENGGVFAILQPQKGESVLDATLGLGGHGEEFLRAIGLAGRLFGLDADAENLRAAEVRLRSVASQCTFVHGNFRSVASFGFPPLDVIFADLGLSSPHLDDPARGFTFREDAPLDLRFDRSRGKPASELLRAVDEEGLYRVLREYGELRESRRIAKALFSEARRGDAPQRTSELRAVIERLCGYRAPSILPQVFQALRIAVNDEIGALEDFLRDAPRLLKSGGRLGVISYHSLEDRRVKEAFRALTTPAKDERTGADVAPAPFRLLTRKPVAPSEAEIADNPRARSAKFRAIRKDGGDAEEVW